MPMLVHVTVIFSSSHMLTDHSVNYMSLEEMLRVPGFGHEYQLRSGELTKALMCVLQGPALKA